MLITKLTMVRMAIQATGVATLRRDVAGSPDFIRLSATRQSTTVATSSGTPIPMRRYQVNPTLELNGKYTIVQTYHRLMTRERTNIAQSRYRNAVVNMFEESPRKPS